MFNNILIGLRVSIFTLILTGIIYPYLVTGLSHLFFPKRASGSLIFDAQQKRIGSELIGQNFKNPAYFFSRPSAAGKGYDGMASGGTNDSPTSQKMLTRVKDQITALKGYNSEKIPIDLVTCSASGLDPHISPQAARWQAPRISLYRDVSLARVLSIIEDHTESPQWIILGDRRVNVLRLNLALDQYFGSLVVSP
ncbi:MAG: potassium-transporting ATPase subunit KdpC [Alphaproteobacteria bacterium]|nr:potassium-transporting ATPase subunit KdpC [Alphaproteobacteria bacterium]